MKALVMGVKQVKGKSAATGDPFDMARCYVMAPIDPVSNAKIMVAGHGYEVAEMEMQGQCLDQFAGIKFPCVLELETESRAMRGQYVMLVVGVERPASVKAAA